MKRVGIVAIALVMFAGCALLPDGPPEGEEGLIELLESSSGREFTDGQRIAVEDLAGLVCDNTSSVGGARSTLESAALQSLGIDREINSSDVDFVWSATEKVCPEHLANLEGAMQEIYSEVGP